MGLKTPDWAQLRDDELMKLRICDLDLRIEQTELQSRVDQLYQELGDRNLQLRPQVYLGDEWFSPEGMMTISVPFYLAHPRLRDLERSHMLDVEGGTEESFTKLLRHEAGHSFDHAFKFSRRPQWKKIFGPPSQEYQPESYRPKPYSKSFVRHLDNSYAQAHPDEDFAETFAVWLSPNEDWKNRYRGWSLALKKLKYVEELAHEVAGKSPKYQVIERPYAASRTKMTLATYYQRKMKEHAESYPDFYDVDLQSIFAPISTSSKPEAAVPASDFIHENRKSLTHHISHWSGESKLPVENLLKKLKQRAEVLKLRVTKSESETLLALSSYLSAIVTHHLITGKYKREKK